MGLGCRQEINKIKRNRITNKENTPEEKREREREKEGKTSKEDQMMATVCDGEGEGEGDVKTRWLLSGGSVGVRPDCACAVRTLANCIPVLYIMTKSTSRPSFCINKKSTAVHHSMQP